MNRNNHCKYHINNSSHALNLSPTSLFFNCIQFILLHKNNDSNIFNPLLMCILYNTVFLREFTFSSSVKIGRNLKLEPDSQVTAGLWAGALSGGHISHCTCYFVFLCSFK